MEPVSVLMDSYQAASQTWLGNAIAAGHGLFLQLAALEIVVFGLAVALLARNGGAETVLPRLAWKLFLIAVLLTGILLYPLWLPRIIPSFTELAQSITGVDSLNPVHILKQGITLAILLTGSSIVAGFALPAPLASTLVGFSVLGILLAFGAIAAQVAKTLIESWIVLSVGPLFLGFAPFRPTATLADNFIVYAFGVGIRLFFLVVMTAVASQVVRLWIRIVLAGGFFSLGTLFEIFLGSVLLAVTLWTIPARIADTLTRGWNLGIKEGLSA